MHCYVQIPTHSPVLGTVAHFTIKENHPHFPTKVDYVCTKSSTFKKVQKEFKSFFFNWFKIPLVRRMSNLISKMEIP
jgi:hypothetical protein